jgi:DMSO/TMAO reductase YedYZ molybdopterin-dependent catalytic subunit
MPGILHCPVQVINEAPAMSEVVLSIEGAVEQPLALSHADLASFPEQSQVHDVSRFQPKRRGDGVTLDAILERARVRPDAAYVTLHADRDDFHVSVPLDLIRPEGIVVYRVGQERLASEEGGPIRLIIRDPSVCHTGELDDCANVKYLSRIELTGGRGRDTRPTTDADHAALHDAQTAARSDQSS